MSAPSWHMNRHPHLQIPLLHVHAKPFWCIYSRTGWPVTTELKQVTQQLATWRKSAQAGVSAVSSMNAAVEKMEAAKAVNTILNGVSK